MYTSLLVYNLSGAEIDCNPYCTINKIVFAVARRRDRKRTREIIPPFLPRAIKNTTGNGNNIGRRVYPANRRNQVL